MLPRFDRMFLLNSFFAVLLILSSTALGRELNVVYDDSARTYALQEGHGVDDLNRVGWSSFADNITQTGWSSLEGEKVSLFIVKGF